MKPFIYSNLRYQWLTEEVMQSGTVFRVPFGAIRLLHWPDIDSTELTDAKLKRTTGVNMSASVLPAHTDTDTSAGQVLGRGASSVTKGGTTSQWTESATVMSTTIIKCRCFFWSKPPVLCRTTPTCVCIKPQTVYTECIAKQVRLYNLYIQYSMVALLTVVSVFKASSFEMEWIEHKD